MTIEIVDDYLFKILDLPVRKLLNYQRLFPLDHQEKSHEITMPSVPRCFFPTAVTSCRCRRRRLSRRCRRWGLATIVRVGMDALGRETKDIMISILVGG